MSTLEELDDLDRRDKDDKKRDGSDQGKQDGTDIDERMKDKDDASDILDDEILGLSTQDILTRKRLLENDSRIMKSELSRLSHEKAAMGEKIKDNVDKIANNRYACRLHSREAGSSSSLTFQQTTPVSCRQCCRVARPRSYCRILGRRCQYRSGCNTGGKICRHQDFDTSDHFFASHRASGLGPAEAW